MKSGGGIFPLKGVVQHYSWGGFEYIPQLLQQSNADKKPCAEYWLGAHPNHPSILQTSEGETPLHQFIENRKEAVLGQNAYARFGRLPYLLKILDVRQMLSIQVHPDIASAKEGFAKENSMGIATNASNRNYKDDNHKPELMVALSDFWLLHGFKSPEKLIETLEAVPELHFLTEAFTDTGFEGMYRRVMTMPQTEVNAILQPILDRIVPLYRNGELMIKSEDFWAARAAETYCKDGNIDRGIFSIFLFNLVNLRKGEGIFQPAGLPHAYLEGQNVELMANSDNVLRAGLTDKYIDVPELLKHVQYQETIPQVLGAHEATKESEHFLVPAPEFELYQYKLENKQIALNATGPEILLVLEGGATIEETGGQALNIGAGEAIFVTANTDYIIKAASGAELFRAAVPQKQRAA
jgi:mannose-6-phosphate isomerase